MLSIREKVWETNSSSLHTLTVACELKNKQLYQEYLEKELERWKKEDGTYEIVIKCTEDSADAGRFDIRHYIPHFSINDKLMYLFASVVQHYCKDLVWPPYDNTPYILPWWKNTWHKRYGETPTEEDIKEYEAKVKEAKDKYAAAYKSWFDENWDKNYKVISKFIDDVNSLSEDIAWKMEDYLFPESEKIEGRIKVKFEYVIDSGKILYNKDGNDCFSTGCYGNEEVYYSIADRGFVAGDWVCNPYSAVLAGSDEQSEEDSFAMEQEALRCLTESYENGYNDYSVDIKDMEDYLASDYCDLSKKKRKEYKKTIEVMKKAKKPNEGKLIYPLGG